MRSAKDKKDEILRKYSVYGNGDRKITSSQIAHLCGLATCNCSTMIKELKDEGLLRQKEKFKGRGGVCIQYELTEKGWKEIGIDRNITMTTKKRTKVVEEPTDDFDEEEYIEPIETDEEEEW